MSGETLSIIAQHWHMPYTQFSGFFRDAFAIVSQGRIDHEQRDTALGKFLAQRFDFRRALAGHRTIVGGKKEHDRPSANPPQFMHASLMIEQSKIEHFARGWAILARFRRSGQSVQPREDS